MTALLGDDLPKTDTCTQLMATPAGIPSTALAQCCLTLAFILKQVYLTWPGQWPENEPSLIILHCLAD